MGWIDGLDEPSPLIAGCSAEGQSRLLAFRSSHILRSILHSMGIHRSSYRILRSMMGSLHIRNSIEPQCTRRGWQEGRRGR